MGWNGSKLTPVARRPSVSPARAPHQWPASALRARLKQQPEVPRTPSRPSVSRRHPSRNSQPLASRSVVSSEVRASSSTVGTVHLGFPPCLPVQPLPPSPTYPTLTHLAIAHPTDTPVLHPARHIASPSYLTHLSKSSPSPSGNNKHQARPPRLQHSQQSQIDSTSSNTSFYTHHLPTLGTKDTTAPPTIWTPSVQWQTTRTASTRTFPIDSHISLDSLPSSVATIVAAHLTTLEKAN